MDRFSVRWKWGGDVEKKWQRSREWVNEEEKWESKDSVRERQRVSPRTRSCLAIIDKAERFKNNEATRWK